MVSLTHDPLDVAALRAQIESSRHGAILVFEGVVRDNFEGRPVLGLEYEAYPEMALAELEKIVAEVRARWPGAEMVIAHRLGRLALGEASVVIVTAAPHRAECYEASRHGIEALKARVPIWKKELYADGATWRENTPG